MQNNQVSKNQIFIELATMPDGDPRLIAVASALSGQLPAEPPQSLRLLKMGESAELSGLSRTTIWRLVKSGALKTVEIRKGSKRIPEDVLRKFVNEGR